MDGRYGDIADLDRLRIDGLIVTGAEPNAATLPEEPFWQDLTAIIDWARSNTRSAIWSCLAAHAAVLHLDGIQRQRLDVKCSGVYDCAKVTDDWLMKGITSPLKVAHSRINALDKGDLIARGYQLLTPVSMESEAPRSDDAVVSGNLPRVHTLIIGREVEVAAIAKCLVAQSLVTLAGSGGIGKTRLALAVGEHLFPLFPDGVWW